MFNPPQQHLSTRAIPTNRRSTFRARAMSLTVAACLACITPAQAAEPAHATVHEPAQHEHPDHADHAASSAHDTHDHHAPPQAAPQDERTAAYLTAVQSVEAQSGRTALGTTAATVDPAQLPPAPTGVTHLPSREFFRMPVGSKGLEYTEQTRNLEGSFVRIAGYLVRNAICVHRIASGHEGHGHGGMHDHGHAETEHDAACDHHAYFIVTPLPVTLHDAEMGPCDDLPATAVYCHLPEGVEAGWVPGPVTIIGRLQLGGFEEPDGRISSMRLIVEPLPTAAPEGTEPHEQPVSSDATGAAAHNTGTHVAAPHATEN